MSKIGRRCDHRLIFSHFGFLFLDSQRVLRQTLAGQLSNDEKTEGWLTCAVDSKYKEHVDKEANLELGHLVPHKWGSAKVSNNLPRSFFEPLLLIRSHTGA